MYEVVIKVYYTIFTLGNAEKILPLGELVKIFFKGTPFGHVLFSSFLLCHQVYGDNPV